MIFKDGLSKHSKNNASEMWNCVFSNITLYPLIYAVVYHFRYLLVQIFKTIGLDEI